MAINLITDPWPHIIIDDFLPKDEFEILSCKCDRMWEGLPERIEYSYDDNVQRWHLNYDPLEHRNIKQYLKYFDYRKYSNLRTFTNFVKTKANFVHGMHVEAPFKILSSILYLSPENNGGTRLFHSGPERTYPMYESVWKPNRMLIFAGQDDVTWHDYTSNEFDRYTFNHFLVDPTVIENELYKTLHF